MSLSAGSVIPGFIPSSTHNDLDAIPDQRQHPPWVRQPTNRDRDWVVNSVKKDRLLVELLRLTDDLESLQSKERERRMKLKPRLLKRAKALRRDGKQHDDDL